jgi:hypothetical protein
VTQKIAGLFFGKLMKNRKKVSFLFAPGSLDRVLKEFHKKWVLWNLFF